MYQVANTWRGVTEPNQRNVIMQGYPPAYVSMIAVVMNLMDATLQTSFQYSMSVYFVFLRFLSVSVDLVTLSVLMLLARQMASRNAMFLAGMIWALSAPLAYAASGAIGDPFVVLLSALCFLFSVRAHRNQSATALILATLAGCGAALFKYYAITILAVPGIVALLLLRVRRRDIWIGILASGLIVLLITLFIATGASSMTNREAIQARTVIFTNIASLQRWEKIFIGFTIIFSPALFALMCGGLLVAMIRRRLNNMALLLGLLCIPLVIIPVPGFLRPLILPLWTLRYVWAGLFFIVLLGAVSIVRSLEGWKISQRYVRIGIVALTLFCLLPYHLIWTSTSLLTDTRTQLQDWFENNAPDRSAVWIPDEQNYRALSPTEGGYSGLHRFQVSRTQTGNEAYWVFTKATAESKNELIRTAHMRRVVGFTGNNLSESIEVFAAP